jgi:pyruvate kinase
MAESEQRKTKIVCTLGPSSSTEESVRRLSEAGMDVARLNSGHLTPEEVPGLVGLVRGAGRSQGGGTGVMLDLQGPRLRVGPLKGSSVVLEPGHEIALKPGRAPGDASAMSVGYDELAEDLEPGGAVLIDDGLIRLEVREIKGLTAICEVLEGGTLIEGKGMNFPGAELRLAAFTDRDRAYLEVGLRAGVDWVAQSFVRNGKDILDLKEAMDELGTKVPVVAKIEKPEAVRNIDELLETAEAIMVARGDLGVEMEAEEVPLAQKDLIAKAVRSAVPVVTATQMLESMVRQPRPTRAEASDIANAILDGSDALMLSAETAVGSHPVMAVETMARIALRTEASIDHNRTLEESGRWGSAGPADAIGFAACKIAADLDAKAIITMTRSGYTARIVARHRPEAPILSVSPDRQVAASMSLVRGATGLVVAESGDLREMIGQAVGACVEAGYVASGDLVVITGGFLDERSGKTNVVHVHTVR